jgi:hypothetical protein
MAGIQYLGQVGSTGTSTGPHKHVYVKELATGKYLDPATIRTPLSGLRIGEKRIPALIKDAQGKFVLNPAAGITLTSKFGPRSAPTAGASTFHRGEDWALPEGTPIYYEGGGKYIPKPNQGGYGNLATFMTGDNKYEIGLGHMKTLGESSDLPSTQLPVTKEEGEEDLLTLGLLSLLQSSIKKPKTFEESMTENMLGELLSPAESPAKMFLQSYISSPLPFEA